jgi:solute carrier family 25 phosphate transporter 3
MAATFPPKSTGSDKLDAAIQTVKASEPQKLSGVALYSRFVRVDLEACQVLLAN